MDAAVAAAVVTGGAALLGSGMGLYLQSRSQRISSRLTIAAASAESRQDANETVMDAWKRIVDAQERRITRLEGAEARCQEELQAVRTDLRNALHDLRP